MTALKGPSTLTFDDGRRFDVDVDIDLAAGVGIVSATKILMIADRKRPGELRCGDLVVQAMVTDGHPNGTGTIRIFGPPELS